MLTADYVVAGPKFKSVYGWPEPDNSESQDFHALFNKEIDRYLAKLATRGKTSAGTDDAVCRTSCGHVLPTQIHLAEHAVVIVS